MRYFLWNKSLFLFLLPIILFAQVKKTDLTRLPYDELKELFIKNDKNQKKQLEYANAFLVKAKYDNSPIYKARGFYLLSLLYKGDKAIHYLDYSISFSKNTNDLKFPAYAYFRKAYELKEQSRFREAIDNFILAENSARLNNTDFYFDAKFSIALLRSEELGEVEEALVLYKECFNYYKDKEVRSPKYSFAYQDVIFALADAHKALEQADSTTYYNKLGYKEAAITKNEKYKHLFILNEGANHVLKKNYRVALDSIYKALPKMIAFKDQGNTLASYYYLGKAYEGLGNPEAAVQNFRKVDSIYTISKKIIPEFMGGYSFLINYYKVRGDKENQLKYMNIYMTIDSTLQKKYKLLTKKLNKEYDTPYLLKEKATLIESLQKEKIVSYTGILMLLVLVAAIGGFALYQYQLKKQYRSRFEKIMQQTTAVVKPEILHSQLIEGSISNNRYQSIGIAEELVQQILEKLQVFESESGFLDSTITIQKVATVLNTNSKYLSKIINEFKGKSFVQYSNDLRIEYSIIQLKKDPKLRNYTIQALAIEFGFNNAESFSTAFFKKTGIKPIYFIKKLVLIEDY
ncbi:AraC-type DNA-binding protein [Flavobacterium omnivorum]|uniref:AraC-type DNA-binding protein n=1 Tax=Flavobacterium omnivorum TaxID=178355 RepID=A0A1G8HYX7_9FLAO|nr:helix-turn-helix domain-containing protein [Flavobacterium omnivorum]SDI11660.1 AraC-type DNA-binding protein [Flavobacterium omnivorum]